MSLKERAASIDCSNTNNIINTDITFEDRVNEFAKKDCRDIILEIEGLIKDGRYTITNNKKRIYGSLCVAKHQTNKEWYVGISPYKQTTFGENSITYKYKVNNEKEAKYYVNALIRELEVEGLQCSYNIKTESWNPVFGSFWERLKSITAYYYYVSYTFEW